MWSTLTYSIFSFYPLGWNVVKHEKNALMIRIKLDYKEKVHVNFLPFAEYDKIKIS
jgi:hypothetical protein